MKKLLLIFLIFLLFVFGIFGQKKSSKNSKSKLLNKTKTELQVPTGWKLVDLDSFSFTLPESMEDQKVRGIDSQVWLFTNNDMELHIDSGMYRVDIYTGGFKSETNQIEIDGVKGQYFKVDYSKPETNESIIEDERKEEPYLQAIVFKHGQNDYSSFWVTYKNSTQEENAKKILYSIKFKHK